MDKLKTYNVFLKLTARGESEMDVLETVYSAVDSCDLLEQDGIVGIEVMEDVEDLSDEDLLDNEEE
jgi:hypothetical protein